MQLPEPQIHHIVTIAQWEAQKNNSEYIHESLAIEGFIHCSTKAQLHHTIKRYYATEAAVVVLTIEVSKLNSELIYELAPSINEFFPHIFGAINNDAIVAVATITLASL